MSNIFKNAYFGKRYKTRDGRKAIYHMFHGAFHELILPDGILLCNNDGTQRNGGEINREIVSEWTISEEELDKFAQKYVSESKPLLNGDSISCFKAGYHTALSKETLNTIIELFISWNGEDTPIDIANINSAVEYIESCLNNK